MRCFDLESGVFGQFACAGSYRVARAFRLICWNVVIVLSETFVHN